MSIPFPPEKPVTITERNDIIPVPSSKPDTAQLASFAVPPLPEMKPTLQKKAKLAENDAALYRKIFSYQAAANWDKADEMMAGLGDTRLRSHILYQRYMHPTSYKASFKELSGWMDDYADYPGADKIYSLSMKRKPADFKGSVKKPEKSKGINGYLDILSDRNRAYRSPKSRSKAERDALAGFTKSLYKDLAGDQPTRAYKKLLDDKTARLLDSTEYDELRAQIANSYMLTGNLPRAKDLALDSARRSGVNVPMAGWVGGLVLWQQGHYKKAAGLFELTANSPYASKWTAAAGAYWASRAHMRAGNIKDVSPWLRRAASHPRTFYGLIATRALGWDYDFNWDIPDYTAAHKALLMKTDASRRAMLLVEAGQHYLAETELRQIDPKGDKKLTEALLAYANYARLPSYAMRLASSIRTPDGHLYDAALYPFSPWTPQNGYKIDKALIYALIRQESKFDPTAQNGSGATGLMQLMPATASFVSGRSEYRSAEGRHSLKEPQVNLDIGQRYVENLLDQTYVGTELFSLVIAYNAGPGNLRKWKETHSKIQNDPLLFVEMIPMKETRDFVEKVMANYWIYRMRMAQSTPSLAAVAEGQWARYVSFDDIQEQAAASSITVPLKPYQVADRANYR